MKLESSYFSKRLSCYCFTLLMLIPTLCLAEEEGATSPEQKCFELCQFLKFPVSDTNDFKQLPVNTTEAWFSNTIVVAWGDKRFELNQNLSFRCVRLWDRSRNVHGRGEFSSSEALKGDEVDSVEEAQDFPSPTQIRNFLNPTVEFMPVMVFTNGGASDDTYSWIRAEHSIPFEKEGMVVNVNRKTGRCVRIINDIQKHEALSPLPAGFQIETWIPATTAFITDNWNRLTASQISTPQDFYPALLRKYVKVMYREDGVLICRYPFAVTPYKSKGVLCCFGGVSVDVEINTGKIISPKD